MKEWDVDAACGTYMPLCVHARVCVYLCISCRMEGNEDDAILAVVPPYPILAFLAGCSHRKPVAFFLLVQHMYACPPYGEPDGICLICKGQNGFCLMCGTMSLQLFLYFFKSQILTEASGWFHNIKHINIKISSLEQW